jgi:hypothetical protein
MKQNRELTELKKNRFTSQSKGFSFRKNTRTHLKKIEVSRSANRNGKKCSHTPWLLRFLPVASLIKAFGVLSKLFIQAILHLLIYPAPFVVHSFE